MRILHIIPRLSGGGAERQLSYLAPELARLGHEVHIAYSWDASHKLQMPLVKLHRLKSISNYDPYLFWQVNRLIQRLKPDIVQTWIMQMDILGGIAARIFGIPWILREASSTMGYQNTWKQRLRIWISKSASAIVSNSKGGDEYWKIQLPDSSRYVIPNGLPLQEINRVKPSLPPCLMETELPLILYVGRLSADSSANKNLKVFIEALAKIKHQQNIAGILCGEGPQKSELKELSHNLGLDENVYFTDHLSAILVWALMKKAAVFVSLSAYEGCPNTVLEAMVCGCPMVLSDIPAHREIIDESCSLFVDPNNIQQTADTIIETLNNTDAAKARALIAKQKTLGWSIEEMAKNYVKVYVEVL